MKRIFGGAAIALGILVGGATAALACPNHNLSGDTYRGTGDDLYAPKEFSVVAGGDREITKCGIRLGSDRGRGYVTEAPDFTFNLSRMDRYRLAISVRSECDAVLLISTGNSNWFYDDDDNGNLDPLITLSRPSNGWLDVWIGTHDGSHCNATLYLETFDR